MDTDETPEASAVGAAARTTQLTMELQALIDVMGATYEHIDVRVETALGRAEADFLAAMPPVAGHETAMRQLVAHLVADLRLAVEGGADKPVLLRFAYQGRDDLVQQFLAGSCRWQVVLPVEAPEESGTIREDDAA